MVKREGRSTAQQPWPAETELRLAGEPETLEAAFASPLITSERSGADKTIDLESRYFDTPDHQLRAQGLALRVRADGESHRQTLKAGDDAQAALLKRGEWNTPVDDGDINLESLPKGAFKLLPKTARKDTLQKIFTTRVQRRTRDVLINHEDQPRSRIEVALDLGEIKTGAGTLPIAEIELELLEGAPQTLYQLALDLQSQGGLRLETRSKSGRAYGELSGQPPRWHRAKDPMLTPSTRVDDAMAVIFESCFDQWLGNQAAAIDGRDPEGVHQMRVGLRRLRSALSIFRKLIPESQVDWLQAGAKQTIKALGPARDWDVFRSDLLAPVMLARPDDRGLRALMVKANARSRTSYRAVRRQLQGDDDTRFALCFGRWVEACAWRDDADAKQAKGQARPIAAFAADLLTKRHKRALADGKGFAELSPKARHDLRLTLKKLRYALEFFVPLFEKKAAKAFLKPLKTLQDDLGHMNDVAVAETLLARLLTKRGVQDLSSAAGLVIGWHMHGVAALEPSLVDNWNAFANQPTFWN